MNYLYILLAIIITTFAINVVVIKIAKIKKLFDDPNENRKVHKMPIPNLGGIGIFFSFILGVLLLEKAYLNTLSINYIIVASLLLFLMGLKDDLVGLSPLKKLFFQISSSLILIFLANIRITNFSEISFLKDISFIESIIITTVFITFIINAYNLIDGINGLAGFLALIFSIICLINFYITNEQDLFIFTLIFIGSIIGFLFLNFGKAKIFMGDNGSYFIGIIIAILSIQIFNNSKKYYFDEAKLAILFSMLIIPLFDTLRVFILRILNQKSPFIADSNHLHHLLLKKKLSHVRITLILSSITIIIYLFNLYFQNLGSLRLIIIDTIFLVIITYFLSKEDSLKS